MSQVAMARVRINDDARGPTGATVHKRELIQRSGRILGLLAFAWILLDALTNYFVRNYTGAFQQVNLVLPPLLLSILLVGGWRAVLPPMPIVIALIFSVFGFLMGPLLVPEIGAYRIVELAGALCAFTIGYSCIRWNSDAQSVARLFLVVGGLYVVVCIVAILKIAPSMFPITHDAWSYHGRVVLRPYIMTDENFQVFYLFPIVLALALPYRFFRFWIAVSLTLGSLYILAKFQTRSGILVFAGTFLLCLMSPIWNRALGRAKLFVLPTLLLVVGGIIGLEWMQQEGDLIIARFVDTDYQTGHGRLVSLTYLFEHVYDPLWWVPRGNAEFAEQYGGENVPHSNITAMFLEGGILGLYMWIVVFLLPVLRLAGMFFRKQLDPLATMILIGGFSMLVVQLSLNVPFFKQPWLWAGAVIGAFYRSRAQLGQMRHARSFSK